MWRHGICAACTTGSHLATHWWHLQGSRRSWHFWAATLKFHSGNHTHRVSRAVTGLPAHTHLLSTVAPPLASCRAVVRLCGASNVQRLHCSPHTLALAPTLALRDQPQQPASPQVCSAHKPSMHTVDLLIITLPK